MHTLVGLNIDNNTEYRAEVVISMNTLLHVMNYRFY